MNGEIYNHEDTRAKFFPGQDLGSKSDCAVTGYLYEKFGAADFSSHMVSAGLPNGGGGAYNGSERPPPSPSRVPAGVVLLLRPFPLPSPASPRVFG